METIELNYKKPQRLPKVNGQWEVAFDEVELKIESVYIEAKNRKLKVTWHVDKQYGIE